MILPWWVWVCISPFLLAYYTVKAVVTILWKMAEVIFGEIDRYNANHPLPEPQRRSVSRDWPKTEPPLSPKAGPGPRDWSPEDS